jgi:copper chaperone CopZ
MKTKVLSLVAAFVLTTTILVAQTVKIEKYKVAGKCDLSKIQIENAAKSMDGVSNAVWDKESKMLELTYDSSEVKVHKVLKAIAKTGHDTKMYKASNIKYEELPQGCQYERITKAEMFKRERFRWIARTPAVGIQF